MQLRIQGRELKVLTFPADDAVFAERVREVSRAASLTTDAGNLDGVLKDHLRRIHPNVETTWRNSLAGFGDLVLYVFRDGTATSVADSESWIAEPGTARVVTDTDGRYVDANDAAETLFAVPREQILREHAGAFTEPDARIEDADALWRALRSTGRLHSLAIVCRPDGSTTSVEFITVRDGDGPGRTVTYLRTIEKSPAP